MNDNYLPLIIAFIIIIAIVILWLILYYNVNSTETFGDTITNIMEDIPGVPTIQLIEKRAKKNILQKILGNVNNSKIPFNIIKTDKGDYSMNIPSYEDFNFAGKGLVIAAAGNRYRYLTGLYANLYVIRKYHKSNIPIEIFYVGKKEEFGYTIKNMILALGNITIKYNF
jgi:hypothetical protein